MKLSFKVLLTCCLLVAGFVNLGGCGCGFDCHSDDDGGNVGGDKAVLTLGFTDSLPEDLTEVWIEVDAITFRRSGGDHVVNDFTIDGINSSTFKVNLLEHPGTDQFVVIKGLELERGAYSGISIAIVDTDLQNSYVVESDGTQRKITVTDDVLNAPGMQLASGAQAFTVEFGLAQALQHQSGSETYQLTSNGLRVENNTAAAILSGSVASELFDTVSECRSKTEPTKGNRVYLYQGRGLANDRLVDVFSAGNANTTPPNALAPYAVATLLQNSNTNAWEYTFGYLPAGEYTLAFACNTQSDDAVQYNGLQIPLPDNQKYEVSLEATKKRICNLTPGGGCPSTQ